MTGILQKMRLAFTCAAMLMAAVTVPAEQAVPETNKNTGAAVRTDSEVPGIWQDEMDTAMALARKENKDILINFSGPEWSEGSVKLESEVFDTARFSKEAPSQFVLVKLDFPKKEPLPEKQAKHNYAWQQKFGVKSFPAIILTDASGMPYARTGYLEGGTEKYLSELTELKKKGHERLAGLAAAAELKGIEKAKKLGEALKGLDDGLALTAFKTQIDEIITCDPQNKTGYPVAYKVKRCIEGIQKYMNPYFPGMLNRGRQDLDRALENLKPTGEALQQLLSVKAVTYLMEENRSAAKREMEKAIAAAPDTEHARLMKEEMDNLFSPFAMAVSEINLHARAREWDQAIQKIDAAIVTIKPEGEDLQQLHLMKGYILFEKGETNQAHTVLQAGLKIDPESTMAEHISKTLESKFNREETVQQKKPAN
jgi:protein disulfide-isomerase